MLDPRYISATGRYYNKNTFTFEFWVWHENPKKCICVAEMKDVSHDPYAVRLMKEFEKEVWLRYLSLHCKLDPAKGSRILKNNRKEKQDERGK